jgi:hypothetical protein
VLCPLILLLLLWVYAFVGEGALKGGPGGKAFGGDYAMFLTAAKLMETGKNPYDPSVLLRAETSLMHQLHRPEIKRSERAQVRVGNPPLLYWAMRPLLGLDFVPAALGSLIGLYVLSVLGFLALLKYFGWTVWPLATFVFVLMPQVVLGAFYGNPIGIVFAAVGASLLLSRAHPSLAGSLMVFAWLKPQVALPVVLLMGAFLVPRRRAFLSGFGLTSAGGLLLTIACTGWSSVVEWVHGLFRYSSDMSIQPDLISLSGLYVRWMPSGPRALVEALVLLLALAVTAYVWLTGRNRTRPLVWYTPLWVMWLLATPYGHFFDEVLLSVPMLALLGPNGSRVAFRLPAIALYLCFLSLLVISAVPFKIYLLPFPLLAIGWITLRVRRDPRFSLTHTAGIESANPLHSPAL